MYFTSLFLLAATALAAPTPEAELEKRANQCGQYQSQSQSGYILATNGWGWQAGTGSQCSQINSVSGNTIAWDTTWTWSGGPTAQQNYARKRLGQYTSIPTTWKWSQTGTNLISNVAYDIFVGPATSGPITFEVMVWLGLYGNASPLSANGYPFTPIASPVIDGVTWDLAYGLNGNVKVYSFVARSRAQTSYTGDLNNFFKYLAANYASNGFNNNLYLQSIQAGPEVFTGTNAKLTTTAYSISVN